MSFDDFLASNLVPGWPTRPAGRTVPPSKREHIAAEPTEVGAAAIEEAVGPLRQLASTAKSDSDMTAGTTAKRQTDAEKDPHERQRLRSTNKQIEEKENHIKCKFKQVPFFTYNVTCSILAGRSCSRNSITTVVQSGRILVGSGRSGCCSGKLTVEGQRDIAIGTGNEIGH